MKKWMVLSAAALAVWLFLRYLLPVSLPFLLGAALALGAEPLVAFCARRLKLPRTAASGIGVTVTLAMATLLLAFLAALMLRQMQSLARILPELAASAQTGIQALKQWLLTLAGKAPQSITHAAVRTVENLFRDGSALTDQLLSRVMDLASGLLSRLPDSALSIGTFLLSGYMLSVRLPALRSRQSQTWQSRYRPMLVQLKQSLLGWLSAQCKLMAITFGVLLVGFWLLRISHAPVWALLIALMDALPLLGTAVALIPWSIVCFLQGETARAVGLLGICGGAMVLRSILEPRLVGKQLGLDPLVTLMAMYTGYRLWGFGGLILAPLLAVAFTALKIPECTDGSPNPPPEQIPPDH